MRPAARQDLGTQARQDLGSQALVVVDPQALEVKTPAPAHSPFPAVLLHMLPSAHWTETGCPHTLRLVDTENVIAKTYLAIFGVV